MPTTPGGIWTPDDNDDWDLTVDLAATAVSIDDAISAAVSDVSASTPLVQRGTTNFVGNSSGAITVSVTFASPYASTPTVVMGSNNTVNGVVLSATPTSVSTTGFTARMISTSPTSGPGFGSTYSAAWVAVGDRP